MVRLDSPGEITGLFPELELLNYWNQIHVQNQDSHPLLDFQQLFDSIH